MRDDNIFGYLFVYNLYSLCFYILLENGNIWFLCNFWIDFKLDEENEKKVC